MGEGPDHSNRRAGDVGAEHTATATVADWAAERALSDLARELGDHRRRLDLLDADGGDPRTAVRTVFSRSYRNLPDAARHAFRLLGLHPGGGVDVHAFAALAGTETATAGQLLDTLAGAQLVRRDGRDRYEMHDVLRAYALHLCATTDPETGRTAALNRMLDHYLATAAAAMDVAYPDDVRRPPVTAETTVTLPADAPAAALAWLDAERATLLAMARYAADHDRPRYSVALARTVSQYLGLGGHYVQAVAMLHIARDAALRVGDEAAHARVQMNLAVVHERQGQEKQAADHYGRALGYLRQVSGRAGEAVALSRLGTLAIQEARPRAAAEHLRRALALYREMADPSGAAGCLNDLGQLRLMARVPIEARRLFREALALAVAVGNRHEQGRAHAGLGEVHRTAGDLAGARHDLERALALFTELGLPAAGDAAAQLATLTGTEGLRTS